MPRFNHDDADHRFAGGLYNSNGLDWQVGERLALDLFGGYPKTPEEQEQWDRTVDSYSLSDLHDAAGRSVEDAGFGIRINRDHIDAVAYYATQPEHREEVAELGDFPDIDIDRACGGNDAYRELAQSFQDRITAHRSAVVYARHAQADLAQPDVSDIDLDGPWEQEASPPDIGESIEPELDL